MQAKVVYAIEHRSWGDDDDRTGWWLVRFIVANRAIIDSKPVARFQSSLPGNMTSPCDVGNDMIDFEEYAKAGHAVLGRTHTMDSFLEAK